MIGFRTVRDGERVAVWAKNGRVRIVDGPKRLLLVNKYVESLERLSAAADEYLVVLFRDGHAEHLPGPASVWFDPVLHADIRTETAIRIASHEAIAVYRRDNGAVERRVVMGPALFVPEANEWLHEFTWHGADPKNPRRKVARALRFAKLWVIPDQMYHDVEGVRTADDALIVVKLMIFFELADIERMLDATHDPVADFINAATADVMDFAGRLTFEDFKKAAERLNRLETYANLTRNAERIGYRVTKVVYRGYAASDKLQAMHDEAIESRTALKLEAETEDQAQRLADLKLEREGERAGRRRELAEREVRHKLKLRREARAEKLDGRRAEAAQEAEARRLTNEVELEHMKAVDTEKARFLEAAKGMDVDLTRYLVAQYRNPDRLIRIAGDGAERLHFHDDVGSG